MRIFIVSCWLLATGGLAHSQLESAIKIASNVGGMGPLPEAARFGRAIAALGDLDGDGIGELAVGAPLAPARGGVWILFLNGNGTVRSSSKIDPAQRGLPAGLAEPDSFGNALAAPGDVDGDGTPDLVTNTSKGSPWILRLAADGSVLEAIPLPIPAGAHSLAGLGDLDADGTLELAVGGPFFEQDEVWILSIDTSGAIDRIRRIDPSAAGITAAVPGFGKIVGAAGDVDGDGLAELAVRSDNGPAGFGTPTVWLLFLDPDGSVRANTRLDRVTTGIGNPIWGFLFGYSIAGIGDLDGDGTVDLAVGAVGDGFNHGAVWVLFLRPNGTCRDFLKIHPPILGARNLFGSAIASVGDLDQDQRPEIAVGQERLDNGHGGIWVLDVIQPIPFGP